MEICQRSQQNAAYLNDILLRSAFFQTFFSFATEHFKLEFKNILVLKINKYYFQIILFKKNAKFTYAKPHEIHEKLKTKKLFSLIIYL